jgi:hypothetical protein
MMTGKEPGGVLAACVAAAEEIPRDAAPVTNDDRCIACALYRIRFV